MTAALISCRWCGRACQVRRGGSPRLFCTLGCRTAFHTAARRWAEQAVASGTLAIAELRRNDPAACTLLSGYASDLLGEIFDKLSVDELNALPEPVSDLLAELTGLDPE